VLALATVGGGFAGVLAAANGFWTTSVNDSRLLALLWLSVLMYSAITIAGLMFVISARVGRVLMMATASMVPWIDLPGIKYHLTSVLYTAITFGPPHGSGKIGTYIEWSSQLGSQFQFRIGGSPDGDWSLGINLFAVLLVILSSIYKQLMPIRVSDS
jgi:hypothetical protein